MCRWMAWHGQPVLMEELLFKSQHGLIDQSLHSRMGAETTNGDGFGVGWYGESDTPGTFKSIEPAWNDRNLRDLAALRVVVRRGFSHDMADMLVHDLERQLPRLQQQPTPVHDQASGSAFAH